METLTNKKISDKEYFDIPAVSASQIKQYDKGAYWFWKTSPFNPDRPPEQDTDAMIFGRVCHCLLLEPNQFAETYEVADFGKSRNNKKYEEMAQATTKTLITPDEFSRANLMIQAVKQHRLASTILDGATAEMPFTWVDQETHLLCKAKLDAVKRTRNGIVVIDYKTSSDIDSILNWPQKLQYPLQAEFYARAVEQKYGQRPCEFVFVIQSNKPGEEDIVCVANVDYESQEVAKDIVSHHIQEINDKLNRWNETADKNIWAAYPERCEMRYSNWYIQR